VVRRQSVRARAAGRSKARSLLVYLLAVPLRRVGLVNLAIAFPDRPLAERKRILRASVLNLGRMAAELAPTCRT